MPEESATNDTAPVDVETGKTTAEAATAAVALAGIELGRTFPVTIPECPHCHKKNIMTKLDTHATWETYVACIVLGILSCLVLWWLPLVLDSCKMTDHKCSKCEEVIGTIDPFSDSTCCKCFSRKRKS